MKLYKRLSTRPPVDQLFKHLWKNTFILRYKIFFWLLLHDRVSTRNILHRKYFYLPSYKCELCHDSTEETTLHLFWDCPFALSCWDSILGPKHRGILVFDEIYMAIQTLPSAIALEITIMGCWHIWMQ